MYAIIKNGSKQYRVEQGAEIDVELLGEDTGSQVEFNQVLFLYDGQATHVGAPSLPNCTVKGEIIGFTAGPKITSMKYKARKNRRKKWGHRQHYNRVKILDIVTG